jgi:hypothetical protein
MSDQARRSISERFAVLRRLAVGLALLVLVTPCTALALSPTAPAGEFPDRATGAAALLRRHGCVAQPADRDLPLPRTALVWPDQQRRVCVPGRSRSGRHAWIEKRAIGGCQGRGPEKSAAVPLPGMLCPHVSYRNVSCRIGQARCRRGIEWGSTRNVGCQLIGNNREIIIVRRTPHPPFPHFRPSQASGSSRA